uniref:Uncharacterized protein n=1 Tax=Arundo donax TaxID=35708 RepID=A0A0A8YEL1_ARUDO
MDAMKLEVTHRPSLVQPKACQF